MPQKTHRREIIEQLLDHLTDFEPASRTGHLGDGGSGVLAMPSAYWHPSVQELLETIDRLGHEPELALANGRTARGSTARAHLLAYYRSEWRIKRPREKLRVVRGVPYRPESNPSTWTRERLVSSWIIVPLVKAAVGFVDERFRGDPFLPDEMLQEVA